jgi:DNA-binding IclR family transcriptional regulator
MAKQGTAVRIQSLARADAILGFVASGPRSGRRLRDIAVATRLAPSTAATLLSSLVALGQVERAAATGYYRLGPRMLELARVYGRQVDLLELGRPPIIRLCQATGETVNLLVPSATTMVVAESLKGDVILKTTSLKGAGMPFKGTASGKCFRAFVSGELKRALVKVAPFAQLPARTLDDLARLDADLAEVRRLGYATEEDEFQPGVIAVAAPILDSDDRILGTLSIHGPSHRFTVRRAARLGGLLKQEARRVSAALP